MSIQNTTSSPASQAQRSREAFLEDQVSLLSQKLAEVLEWKESMSIEMLASSPSSSSSSKMLKPKDIGELM